MANKTFLDPQIYLHGSWRAPDLQFDQTHPYQADVPNFHEKLFDAIRPAITLLNLMGYETQRICIGVDQAKLPDPLASIDKVATARLDGVAPYTGTEPATMMNTALAMPGVRLDVIPRFSDPTLAQQLNGPGDHIPFFIVPSADSPAQQVLHGAHAITQSTLDEYIPLLGQAWIDSARGVNSGFGTGLLPMYDPSQWTFPQMPGETPEQCAAREDAFVAVGQVVWEVINADAAGIVPVPGG